MISSVHPGSTTTLRDRRGSPKVKPLVIDRYNYNMGRVDEADQYSVYYSFGKRSVKWWRKLMFWLMEVALVYLFILYKTTVDKPVSHANY